MRYSKTTNTLVIISNHYESPYDDRWIDGVFHYNGMGLKGNQKLSFMQNKTLTESNENGVEVFLFEIFDDSDNKYIFMGPVVLIDEPYSERQLDIENIMRDVWVFPLKPLVYNPNEPLLAIEILEKSTDSKVKRKNIAKLTDNELERRAKIFRGTSSSRKTTVTYYERNRYVSTFVKKRANGFCDLCDSPAPFLGADGEPYLEAHHIVWLSNDGEDSIENMVALCPNCHRKIHALNHPADLNKLKSKYRISKSL
ncbi:HNH endonuclease [Peribacillus simplex]|nr:HNH endonuclease [Peribacillus simplex]